MRKVWFHGAWVSMAIVIASLIGSGAVNVPGDPTPTPTATITASPTATVTPTATPSNGTANLWTVSGATPAGTCTRSTTAITYAAAVTAGKLCRSTDNVAGALKAAAAAATSGDTIGIANDAVYGAQAVNGVTKTLTFTGDPDARPTLRQIAMDDTSANLTFKYLDLVRGTDATNNSATFSNGTGTGAGSDNITVEEVTIDSSYLPNRTGLFDEGSNNTYRHVSVGGVVNEKGALIGGDHLTFDDVDFHDVYVTSDLVHNECMYSSGSVNLTIRNSHFYNCQTIDLQQSRFCGNGGSPAGAIVHDVLVENTVFEHTLIQLGSVGTPDPDHWHAYSVGWVGNGLACSQPPAGDPIRRFTFRNNTFETTTPIPTDIVCEDGCVWANNIGNWSCGTGWTYSHNVGSACGGTDVTVSPSTSTPTVPAAFNWVNPAGHNFHLGAGSPAIGACDPARAPTTDKDGVTRGSTCDAGAYER